MFRHLPDLHNSKHRARFTHIHHYLFSRVYHIKYILLFVSSVIFELDSNEILCQIVTIFPCVLYVSYNKMAINYYGLGNLLGFFHLLVQYKDTINNYWSLSGEPNRRSSVDSPGSVVPVQSSYHDAIMPAMLSVYTQTPCEWEGGRSSHVQHPTTHW